jgi:hypothetical protein
MPELTRQDLVTALNQGWACYVPTFRRFSEPERAVFLEKQGYARLADLLGHVVAWWERGLEDIPQMLEDPAYQSPNVDVDDFNAQAVYRFRLMDEDAMIRSFLNLIAAWLDLIENLPEEALADTRIRDRLHIELVGHLEEHIISEKPA